MKTKFSAAFSPCYTNLTWDKPLLEVLLTECWQNLEINGVTFESDFFTDFHKKILHTDKKIIAIHEVLPVNISKNWSYTQSSIREELITLMKRKLAFASGKGIKFFRLDLGLDQIKPENVIEEIQSRYEIIAKLLGEAEKCGITLCQPVRVPKPFPSSQEWRYGTMLISAPLHNNFRLEIDVFPVELKSADLNQLFKKLYYYPTVIRLRYEPSFDGGLKFSVFKNLMDSLLLQGFNGTIIFSPFVISLEQLQKEMRRTAQHLKDYLATELHEDHENGINEN